MSKLCKCGAPGVHWWCSPSSTARMVDHVREQQERIASTMGECDLCYRKILAPQFPALCTSCAGTARAHARLAVAEREWKEDGSP